MPDASDASQSKHTMRSDAPSLIDLSVLAPRDFVQVTYDTILGRPPTTLEREEMLSALLRGDTRTWLAGKLRYGAEGRRRGIYVPGLRIRYTAQRLFRVPGIGPLLEWLNAFARLPSSLRHLRANMHFDAERHEQMRRHDLGRIAEIERQHEDHLRHRQDDAGILTALQRRHEDLVRHREHDANTLTALQRRHEDLLQLRQNDLERIVAFEGRHDELLRVRQRDLERLASLERESVEVSERTRNIIASREAEARSWQAVRDRIDQMDRCLSDLSRAIEGHRLQHEELNASINRVDTSVRVSQSRLDSIFPPVLDEVLEVHGIPLVTLAKERMEISPEVHLSALTRYERYSLFETVFYESPAVSAKQRVYVPYLDLELARKWPFLDLGCGRGEFLRILRDEGITTVGVDINPTGMPQLRGDGFDVVEQDLLAFLETDRRTYSGASLLQVAEHLTDSQIERMLVLVAARLAPGAVFILETPNPISVFALSVFHTDATHLRPLPPERMRYEIEAAGFEQTRTLFQARIPREQFAGPDPRAYYADYAIIATRASS